MVSGVPCSTGSGKAAIATRLTLAAAIAAPAMPAVLKNSRLEFIVASLIIK
jgi:hypothetical protein